MTYLPWLLAGSVVFLTAAICIWHKYDREIAKPIREEMAEEKRQYSKEDIDRVIENALRAEY